MKTNASFFVRTSGQPMNRLALLSMSTLLLVGLLMGCQDHIPPLPPAAPSVPGTVTLVRGLQSPSGIDIDPNGRVWVAETGTGKNDGRVLLIDANGNKNPVITNFEASIFQGEPAGLSHILFADGLLYMLHSNGKLYKANVASFNIGDPTLAAQDLPTEDIGAFVRVQTVADNPDHDSHPYQMALGPNGDLFIADAGANIIVRRGKGTGALSVFANIPGIPNPLFPLGPPNLQSVPTGIAYDGQNLLVSTLNGFPFPTGRATIYQITPAGAVTKYQEGFNSMTGIDVNSGPIALEYGTFGLPAGWTPNTGRLVRANKPGTTVLTTGLNEPTALKKISANSYYVTSLGDGTLLKVTF